MTSEVKKPERGYAESLNVGLERLVIQTDDAPAAIGPYSQAIRVDSSVFTAGQIPLDPATGKLVDGDIKVQARQVMNNLSAILTSAGTSLANVVKTTIFLVDMDHFADLNAVYGEFFEADPPARSTVQVSRLPLDALVEIEAIAIVE